MRAIGVLLQNVVWPAADLFVAAYDWLAKRDPDAELRRFLADHPDTRWYYPDGEQGL